MDYLNITAGDLLTHGTFLIDETPECWVWLTREGDQMFISHEMKPHVLQALYDTNQEEANSFNKSGSHGETKVASIPIAFYYDLQRRGITDDPEALKRILNNSTYSKFRTNDWTV
ncbi:hypothetical protein [Ensifer canadensis]